MTHCRLYCALVWSVGCKMITERKSTIQLRFSPFCTASAEKYDECANINATLGRLHRLSLCFDTCDLHLHLKVYQMEHRSTPKNQIKRKWSTDDQAFQRIIRNVAHFPLLMTVKRIIPCRDYINTQNKLHIDRQPSH